jgi:SAM-dependent methyltransferase
MTASVSCDDIRRDMLASLAADHLVTDVAFDHLYPEHIRKLSERFWTPIDIARRAARLFAAHNARRVLDVGAGVGKFCIVSALTADLELTGIEHREGLVAIADGILRAFSIPRVHMRHASLEDVDLDAYDGFYLYNPFDVVGFASTEWIGPTIPLKSERAERDVERIEAHLAHARPGTCMVTFHGFGGTVPPGWIHLAEETRGAAFLRLWVRG